MSECLVDPIGVRPDQLGVSQWFIPAYGQAPLLDNQVEEPITGAIEFKDKVKNRAGWIEIVLPCVVSSVVLGAITIPSVLHQMPARPVGLSALSDHAAAERVIVPDLQLEPRVEDAATEPRVVATADGPAAATALPATIDGTSDRQLPQQPPEPPASVVPRAPVIAVQ